MRRRFLGGIKGENNVIHYTSTDNLIIAPNSNDFGSIIINNEMSGNIGTMTFLADITIIGGYTFSNSSRLKSIDIPNSVTSIGDSAFAVCTSLTSIIIPDSVSSIGEDAFYGCTSLPSITIPDSVTSIGAWAFGYCSNLASVYCKPTTPPTSDGGGMFSNNALDRKIYVPAASVEAYKAASYWSDYATDIVGYDFENDTVVGGGNEIEFPVTLVAGDNGELGVKLYNYLIAVLPENTAISCPNDEYGIGEIIIQGWGNAEYLTMRRMGEAGEKHIFISNSKMMEEGNTPTLRSNGFFN